MQYRSGQTLSEYTLVGCLVSVVAIVGLIGLGGNLDEAMRRILPSPSQKAVASPAVTAAVPAPLPMDGPIPVSLTGQTVLVDMAPVNAKNNIQTAGVNGTTTLLANQLIAIEQDLAQNGELTPEQASLFSNLANQGHRMANIERLVEQAATMATDTESYRQVRLTLDGQQYAPDELHNMLGWKDAHMHAFMLTSPEAAINMLPEKQSVELKTFLSMYSALAQSNALQNPQVKASVDQLVTQIAFLSDVTKNASAGLIRGDWSVPMKDLVVSESTDINSVGICQNGQQTDTRQSCQ
jgi:polyhydroxyalkanoate synthesis regulator phasin